MKHFIFMVCLISATCALALTSTVQAQPYPNRPVQLVIPLVAGSTGDVAGRLLAEGLEKILGTPFVPINKPGASQIMGTDAVVRSKKDGYTLLYTATTSLIYTRVLNPETVPYDPEKDLEPLGLHVFFPLTVSVREDSPWKTFRELIDYAKQHPGKISVSTHGQGGIDHFNAELTQALTDVKFNHIPFKGGQPVVTAMLGGHVDVTYTALSQVVPHVKAGTLRILLISKKMPEFPNVPLITDFGYKQNLFSAWMAMFAPVGVPEEVKRVLIPAIEKAVKNPELKAKTEPLGFIVDYKSPAELKKLMVEDYQKAMDVALKAGLRK
jgi:tripartite-type tricarboxylate transporter receptor subunit TctC